MIGEGSERVYADGMHKVLATASRLKGMWVYGVTVLLLLVLAAAAIGIVVALLLGLLSEVFGWRDGAAEAWIAITALVWLPIAVGNAFRYDAFKNIVDRANRELDKYRSR